GARVRPRHDPPRSHRPERLDRDGQLPARRRYHGSRRHRLAHDRAYRRAGRTAARLAHQCRGHARAAARQRHAVSEPLILGIETSCDETSAAVLRGERTVLGHVILSQDAHRVYGGVVPEIASRAHLQVIDDVADGALREAGVALRDLDAIAATGGPGLVGAPQVGLAWSRAAAFGLGIPLVPVHHMEAHLFATSLDDARAAPPFVALLVSGGHTMLLWVPAWGEYELLGETRDDAAGEAFDKVARILGLGFPGGPRIERIAREGDPGAHRFPRPMLASNQQPGDPDYYDFSFSGLKTAVLNRVRELEAEGWLEAETANLAASFQATVVDVLVAKTMRAVEATGCRRVLLG